MQMIRNQFNDHFVKEMIQNDEKQHKIFFSSVFSDLGSILQHFIFAITYKLAQLARVFHYTKLKMLTTDKHSLLVCPFVSYNKGNVVNTVRWMYLQHLFSS